MGARRKMVPMTVTVSVPACFTPAEARREVRSLIKEGCLHSGGKWNDRGDWVEFDVGKIGVKPGKISGPTEYWVDNPDFGMR